MERMRPSYKFNKKNTILRKFKLYKTLDCYGIISRLADSIQTKRFFLQIIYRQINTLIIIIGYILVFNKYFEY